MKPGLDAVVEIIECHAEGEVGDVIVSGIEPPPGDTVWEQAAWIAQDQTLRNFVLNEPRGGVFRHVNLIIPAKHREAAFGWIVMEPEDTPLMSGSNSICVSTVLLETGLVEMREPETKFVLEAPGGLVNVSALCRNGKAERITVRNLPCFADRIEAPLEVEGFGTLIVDTAYGGDTFVLVDASSVGFEIRPDEARDLCAVGMRIRAAAGEQLGFVHPTHPEVSTISFCQFTNPVIEKFGQLVGKNAVIIRPGRVDRSPTGTGLSARLAVLHAKKVLSVGDTLTARSIIDSEFVGRIDSEVAINGRRGIRPTISGRAWTTGRRFLKLDPRDPFPEGYRISDTWPNM